MTIRVELNPEMEARLVAEARSQGVPFGEAGGATSRRGFDRQFAPSGSTDGR